MLRHVALIVAVLLAVPQAACAAPAPSPGAAAALTAAEATPAQASTAQPRIRNTQVTVRAVAQNLDREVRDWAAAQREPAWIGYAVPAANDRSSVCCGSWHDGAFTGGCCRMEHDDGMNINTRDDEKHELGPVSLEPAVFVFYRAAEGRVTTVRVFSADCELDASGRPVTWLTGVRPADSVALLKSLIRPDADWSEHDDRSLGKRVVTAIALHAGGEADRALEEMAAPSRPDALRKHVTFWLGSARGRFGYQLLRRILRDDPSDKVREQAVFGLYVSHEPESTDAIIAVARDDRSSKVRGQALFWLGQKAGKKAAAAITDAIENDPDTSIKKKAVFALSQLPKDEGVPLLIQVARTNRNPAVRKQAIFWLGQSGDPRALSFFEEVLKN
jgi:hypothetical protein